jgi:hypothetical protein
MTRVRLSKRLGSTAGSFPVIRSDVRSGFIVEGLRLGGNAYFYGIRKVALGTRPRLSLTACHPLFMSHSCVLSSPGQEASLWPFLPRQSARIS